LAAFVASAPHAGIANADVSAATADAIRSLFMFTSGTMWAVTSPAESFVHTKWQAPVVTVQRWTV
jgi:hypothetical protein